MHFPLAFLFGIRYYWVEGRNMALIEEPLRNKEQSILRIFQICRQFHGDLDLIALPRGSSEVSLSSLDLLDYYDFVRSMPYRQDVEPIEVVARPQIIVERFLSGIGRDCKKASVMLGSYFTKKRIRWRLVTMSSRPDRQMHHIFPQIFLEGEWGNMDATYSYMRPLQAKTVTAAEYFNVPITSNPLR
jgi:hypothetical protein